MWLIQVVCSDPDCAEEREVFAAELDEVEGVVCDCGCSVVALSVADFEPVHAGVAR